MRPLPLHIAALFLLAIYGPAHAERAKAKAPAKKRVVANTGVGAAYVPGETEVNDIKLSLVNDDGKAVRIYSIPREESERNLFFRLNIDPRHVGFKRAIIEIADREKAVAATIDLGKDPRSITRWDGRFSDKKAIEANTKYLIRAVIFKRDGKALSSAWNYFSTRKRTVYDDARRVRQKPISLYVLSDGSAYSMMLVTKNQRAFNFPSIRGELELIYEDIHTVALKLEATPNTLFGFKPTASSYYYSDLSLAYKYRLLGKPIRSPAFPPNDPTGRGRSIDPYSVPRIFGEALNSEVGFRLFSTTLRGAGGAPLDAELPRHIEGVAAGVWMNYGVSYARLYLSGELGYSVFTGKMLTVTGDAALVYDRLANFAPGLQLRVLAFKGKALPDAFSATTTETDITSLLVMAGVVLKFKL